MKDGSIFFRLQAYAESKQELDLEALREQAEEKCKPGTYELTKDAIQEARDHFFDPKKYRNIISSLRNSNSKKLLPNIMVQYNAGVIDLEKLFRENSTSSLASLYPHYKNHLNTERLLLANPTKGGSRTTFAHELFSNNCLKEDIIHFFKELDRLGKLNPELMNNYLALSDTDGKSIRQLLEEKSLTESYRGIAEEIKASCSSLYPRNPLNVANIANAIEAVGTHTASIHGSVDKSFVKLASIYDSNSILSSTEREVRVNRNAEWLRSIEADFKELEESLRAITENDKSITKFITPTLVAGEDQELTHKKFKFQAETALRMIDGLNAGRYGNHLIVLANEEVSCGLTPKEIVAISYASLKDVKLWNNPEQKQQHFIQFIESLYISKRGYNVDMHGADEWNRSSPEADENKCTGGAINQIATGLRDHLDVEVKVITTETMEPILSTKLADTLGDLASSLEHKALINNWLKTGTINSSLTNLILTKLKEDEEFSQEFSQSEIEKIGSCVLNKLQKEKLDEIQEKLQNNFPEIFHPINFESDAFLDKTLTYSFSFKEDKGYVPYLESLYHTDRDRFNLALQSKLTADITDNLYDNDANKTNLMLSLLLASQDEAVAEATKEIFQDHVAEFNQEIKDQYLILMAEQRHSPLLTALKNTGADVNAHDVRFGHNEDTALHFATGSGQVDIITKLLALGADIEVKGRHGRTALHMAIIMDKFYGAAKLLDLGADIESKDDSGRTALHAAAGSCRVDKITKLVDLGMDIEAKDDSGRTPLSYAARSRGVDKIVKLVNLGADINAKDSSGRTALSYTAESGRVDAIVKLIELGLDINAKDSRGETASHVAARRGRVDILAALLYLGSDISAKNESGRTALSHAAGSVGVDKIADAVIKNKSVIPAVMNNLIKRASGYIQDDVDAWRLVEEIIVNLPQTDRLEIVSEALKEIDNTSRRDALLSFIPEEERNLVRAKVSPTMWEAIRETAELMHGNSSVDVPKRPESYAKRISEEAKNKDKDKDKGHSRF